MSRKKSRYIYKIQTLWTRFPAAIQANTGDRSIAIRIHPEHRPQERSDPATIFMTPHEAQAFAAWLSEQAEHLLAKEARAAARKAARAAAKEAKS